jgi:hypothetical protein
MPYAGFHWLVERARIMTEQHYSIVPVIVIKEHRLLDRKELLSLFQRPVAQILASIGTST